MVKKDYKELDEAIKAKIQPYLYNEGKGAMVPIAQLACLRNRDRSKSKMVYCCTFLNAIAQLWCIIRTLLFLVP